MLSRFNPFAKINEHLHRIEAKIDAGFAEQEKYMADLDDQIKALTDEVAAETTIDASIETFLEGVPALITAAVAKAQAAGATPAQLQSITDAVTALKANSAALQAALVAGTPAA